MHSHEEAIIRSFFLPTKRDRYISLLSGPRREKALNELNHLKHLDPRYCTELPSNADVLRELRARGAPDTCYVLADMPDLDGREMTLAQVLEEIASGNDLGVLVGCIPNNLAHYHGEYGERRVLLERRTG
jgi:hypothetical protein